MKATRAVEPIVKRYKSDKSALISILQDIQAKDNYLSEPVIREVADRLNLSLQQVVKR